MTQPDVGPLVELLRDQRWTALTGAGISTDSGIPDYRGPDSPPRTPMTYDQFVSDEGFRRHYWARNHVGWQHMRTRRPNTGHQAIARMEERGLGTGVISQHVDLSAPGDGTRRVR